jgi:hypothetical protein
MKVDRLEQQIEKGLTELLSEKSKKNADDKEELRKNILLAIKWQAVKAKKMDNEWGAGFRNKEAEAANDGLDDEF